jgi:hypothetical protein
MSPDAQQILEASLALPTNERARVARELIASLDIDTDDDAETSWRVEIERRAREINDGTVELRDWAEVRQETLARLSKK